MNEKNHLFSNHALKMLLIPLVAEQFLTSLMGTADSMMVSNVGSAAISAVSLVDSINVLVIQAFAALSAGGTIVCSQYMGQKNLKKATESARQLLLAVASISVLVMTVCLAFRTPLLRLVFGKVDAEVMDASKIYFLITSLSFPFIALYDAGASVYRAQGDSATPLRISVVANCLNITGNAVLIWVFHMGVAGAAYATQIGMILKIGIPSGVENSMFQFGKLAIQSTVSTMGTVAIAAQAMTNILENLNGVAAIGIGIGLMTVVGECMGAGRKDEAVYYVKKLSVIAEVIIIICCGAIFLLTKPITTLGGMEPESASLCFHMITWITIVKPIVWTAAFIPAYGLRAAGDVKFSMIISCLTMWLCRVSLCIFLSRHFGMGPMAVWIGMFSDWTLRGIFFGIRFHSRKWLEKKVIQ